MSTALTVTSWGKLLCQALRLGLGESTEASRLQVVWGRFATGVLWTGTHFVGVNQSETWGSPGSLEVTSVS